MEGLIINEESASPYRKVRRMTCNNQRDVLNKAYLAARRRGLPLDNVTVVFHAIVMPDGSFRLPRFFDHNLAERLDPPGLRLVSSVRLMRLHGQQVAANSALWRSLGGRQVDGDTLIVNLLSEQVQVTKVPASGAEPENLPLVSFDQWSNRTVRDCFSMGRWQGSFYGSRTYIRELALWLARLAKYHNPKRILIAGLDAEMVSLMSRAEEGFRTSLDRTYGSWPSITLEDVEVLVWQPGAIPTLGLLAGSL